MLVIFQNFEVTDLFIVGGMAVQMGVFVSNWPGSPSDAKLRVTISVENRGMSGNLTDIRELTKS